MGPFVLYAAFYFFRKPIYNTIFGSGFVTTPPSEIQTTACMLWSAHFFKRLFESVFVHRFSNPTMPIMNLFKNCSYYWLYAVICGYFINHPLYTSPTIAPSLQASVGFYGFIAMMCANLYSHLQLRWLRPPGTTKRAIPRGFLFNFVTCPNYFTEIAMWGFFSIYTQSVAAVLFTITGAYQMYMWAVGKHRRYKIEFNGQNGTKKYPRRKVLIPFLL